MREGLVQACRADPDANQALESAIEAVRTGRASPTSAARDVLSGYLN